MVSAIMGILNHRKVDNGDVEVYTLYQPLEYTSTSVPYLDNIPINSINYYELDQLLKFFQSKYDGDILDVYLQILQD